MSIRSKIYIILIALSYHSYALNADSTIHFPAKEIQSDIQFEDEEETIIKEIDQLTTSLDLVEKELAEIFAPQMKGFIETARLEVFLGAKAGHSIHQVEVALNQIPYLLDHPSKKEKIPLFDAQVEAGLYSFDISAIVGIHHSDGTVETKKVRITKPIDTDGKTPLQIEVDLDV